MAGLKQALLAKPEQFASAVTEKLLMYALGRNLQYYDVPAVRAIVRAAARDNYRFSSMVMGIVKSAPFQMRSQAIARRLSAEVSRLASCLQSAMVEADMFITKKALPRRTFLRGAGATLALPLLDAMIPALSAAGKPTPRLGFIYVSNGVIQDQWIPAATGANFELPAILKPLAPVRDHVNVLSGLSHLQADTFGDGTGDHPRSSAVWLTGVHAYDRTRPGVEVRLATTADQIAVREIGKGTQVASLELSVDFPTQAGCDSGDCFYVNTVSWRNETTPNLAETHPRIVFERLFGDGGSAAERMSRGEGHRKHSRFGHRRSELPRRDARPRRPHQADRIPRLGPRNRAAHPERGVEGHAVGRAARPVRWASRIRSTSTRS